jgi:hypothetical protein
MTWLGKYCDDCKDLLMKGFIAEYVHLIVDIPNEILFESDRNNLKRINKTLSKGKYITLNCLPKHLQKEYRAWIKFNKMWNCHLVWRISANREDVKKWYEKMKAPYTQYKRTYGRSSIHELVPPITKYINGTQMKVSYNPCDDCLYIQYHKQKRCKETLYGIYKNGLFTPGMGYLDVEKSPSLANLGQYPSPSSPDSPQTLEF